jgi:hypothetical protein
MTFDEALTGFMTAAQAKADMRFEQPTSYGVKLFPIEGTRYIKVVAKDTYKGEVQEHSGSAWCFVDKSNGDVLKTAGWNKPAKGARGTIFDADFGASGITGYGAVYRR